MMHRVGELRREQTPAEAKLWAYLRAQRANGVHFRRKAHVLPVGSRVFQCDQTRTKNLAVPITELNPLGNLFARVREWGLIKKQDPGS